MAGLLRAIIRQAAKNHLKWSTNREPGSKVRAVFVGDFVSTRVLLDCTYEWRELSCLARTVFSGMPHKTIALDVGANIGNHALFFAEHFGRVVAFEPNPMVAKVLKVNAARTNIQVVPIGLSDRAATLHFEINTCNLGASRVVTDPADTTIEVVPLDALAGELKLDDVSFIKIDVEGHEDKVISGAARLLASAQPVIALEGWYEADQGKGRRVDTLLRGFGYRHFYRLSDRRPKESRARYLATPKFLLRRRALRLEKIGGLIGFDHEMAICSAQPIATR